MKKKENILEGTWYTRGHTVKSQIQRERKEKPYWVSAFSGAKVEGVPRVSTGLFLLGEFKT